MQRVACELLENFQAIRCLQPIVGNELSENCLVNGSLNYRYVKCTVYLLHFTGIVLVLRVRIAGQNSYHSSRVVCLVDIDCRRNQLHGVSQLCNHNVHKLIK